MHQLHTALTSTINLWTADVRTRQMDSARRAAAARLVRLHEDAIDMFWAASFDGMAGTARWWFNESRRILDELEAL